LLEVVAVVAVMTAVEEVGLKREKNWSKKKSGSKRAAAAAVAVVAIVGGCNRCCSEGG